MSDDPIPGVDTTLEKYHEDYGVPLGEGVIPEAEAKKRRGKKDVDPAPKKKQPEQSAEVEEVLDDLTAETKKAVEDGETPESAAPKKKADSKKKTTTKKKNESAK